MSQHTLPKLPYAYDALEKAIDAQTMEIHYTKHHQGYVDKLNAALEGHDNLVSQPIEALLSDLSSIPEDIRTAVQNNGGGHLNHSLFWESLTPDETKPEGSLHDALVETFGSIDSFKETFTQEASTRFGSGWAWLVKKGDTLAVYSTPNQDSPCTQGDTALLGLDVWEHAYYLRYQNKRPDYIEAFWNVMNWDVVGKRFEEGK